ncbi:MAG: hypothetical protein WCT01_00565 [Candidatus Shapirobacteria bacterium]
MVYGGKREYFSPYPGLVQTRKLFGAKTRECGWCIFMDTETVRSVHLVPGLVPKARTSGFTHCDTPDVVSGYQAIDLIARIIRPESAYNQPQVYSKSALNRSAALRRKREKGTHFKV